MTTEQIKEVIKGITKGANISITYERPVKVKKAYQGMPLTKKTTMQIRLGVSYDNISDVKQAREDGTLPSENQGLHGMEWEQYPFLMKGRNGKVFLRCYLGTFSQKAETKYLLDCQEVRKENYLHTMLASEKGDKPINAGGVFNLPVETIISLHHEEVVA